MAAEVHARTNKQQTIAFTLPISCQICLGKVKNPVLCPNQHVFCGPCMDVWLQKNKQCPACRVSMTSTKKIIGGLSHTQEDEGDKLTNPDLRKARFDILYNEYENEFERMSSEIMLLKTENQILRQQTKKDGLTPSRAGDAESSKAKDTSHLLALTKKLQDATKLYEKVKGDLSKLKQENTNLKDENLSLNRENQHVRQELAGRSPHRYGRTTVSTLETKLASAEKDVNRLTKALERSDKYIEELETELEGYRGKPGASKRHNSASDRDDKYLTNGDAVNRKYSSDSKVPSSREYSVGADNPSRRQLFSEESGGGKSGSGERSKYYYDRNGDYNDDMHASKAHAAKSNSSSSNGGKKRVTFDLDKNTNSAMSFDLELPSPLKNSANASGLTNGRASPVKGVLKKGNNKSGASDRSNDGYSTDMSKDSLSDSYNKKYSSSDRYAKDDDLLYIKSGSRTRDRDFEDELYSKPRRKYSADDSALSEPSDLELRRTKERDYGKRTSDYNSRGISDDLGSKDYRSSHRSSRDQTDTLDRHDLDDTQNIESELDELNISLTPEFTDCMKILNRAEKNVHRDSDTEDIPPSRYAGRTSTDSDMDTAFRASTGSIGYKQTSVADDLRSTDFKADTNKFTSSLDSYSRGRHVRSGSLDNLLNLDRPGDRDRPSSALPTSTNMYPPSNQNKYSSGLTTGRTTLTRTPSLDNLYMSRPEPGALKGRSYLGSRLYRGENDNADGKSSTGSGSSSIATLAPLSKPLPASHDLLGANPGSSGYDRLSGTSTSDLRKSAYDAVLDARSRVYAGDIGTDKLPPTGRSTPTFPLSGTGMDVDKHAASGRVTPTIPTHAEYMAMSQPSTDKHGYTSTANYTGTSTGRSNTNTLTTNTDYSSHTNPASLLPDFRSSGPSSLPTDFSSQKPPSGARPMDTGFTSRSANTGSYPASNPSYITTSFASSVTNPGDGYSSLPTHMGGGSSLGPSSSENRALSSQYSSQSDVNKYTSSSLGTGSSRASEFSNDYGASSNYRSDSKFSSSGTNVPPYNDHHYKDGTDFSNFSTKVAVNSGSNNSNLASVPMPGASLSSANQYSASSTGQSYPSGTSYSTFSMASSMGSYPGSSAYAGSSSYLTSSLTSSSSTSSYASAHSVPLTHTTSSYTSSLAASSGAYNSGIPGTGKPLDPIAESGHFSYVSNASGVDYSSKNDTFALPEPKKRLFENSDDLEMSMSPIKSNRLY